VPGRFDLTLQDLSTVLGDQPAYRTRQVWRSLHQGREPEEMTDLPRTLRSRLTEDLPPGLRPATTSVNAEGDTTKWLWTLADGAQVETVLMAYPSGRVTVCVSTQAGCAMACSFCATGQAGFRRQLTAGEIVEQVIRASRHHGGRVRNVVFMGMGEPLANYPATWAAVERLHFDVGLSARHLTVSTVGIVPGIHKLAEEQLPLSAVVDACQAWVAAKNRRLSFEWALIDGVNDRPSDAGELADIARPLAAHVNLIPLNPTPGYLTRGTPPAGVRAFRDRLVAAGVNATVRRNRGTDIAAACGQLATGGQPPLA
jgi:23S rRNA (adenine2503-C2)-methyltransferase